MSVHPEDNAAAMAIQMEVGHPAPFSEAECASVDELIVHGSRDLSGLGACHAATLLDAFACDVDLAVLAHLPNLRHLRLSCCKVTGLEHLADCPDLDRLELAYCDVQELDPLLDHPRLRRGVLVGLPLDDRTWTEVRPRLITRRMPEHDRRTAWQFDRASDLKTTRELWEAGCELCFAWFDDRLPILVKPGVPRSMRLGVDYVIARPDVIRDVLGTGEWTTETLFKAVVRKVMGRQPRKSFNVRSAREVGDDQDALRWIDRSRADAWTKAHLATFVSRFPDHVFFRESPGLSGLDDRSAGIKVPVWLVNYRVTLAGVAPDHSATQVAVHFHATDQPLPAPGSTESSWFSLGLFGLADSSHRSVAQEGWYCVGVAVAGHPLVLVARQGDDPDQKIYVYDPASLDNGGFKPTPVFESWGSLLDRVDAIRIRDRVFEAKRR